MCLSEGKIKKKRGLDHHVVIFGSFSHPVIDIALVLISTDLESWDFLEL